MRHIPKWSLMSCLCVGCSALSVSCLQLLIATLRVNRTLNSYCSQLICFARAFVITTLGQKSACILLIITSRVEVGWNTSTVALRVVQGAEQGTRCGGGA
jgi:Na+/phosphate symporter